MMWFSKKNKQTQEKLKTEDIAITNNTSTTQTTPQKPKDKFNLSFIVTHDDKFTILCNNRLDHHLVDGVMTILGTVLTHTFDAIIPNFIDIQSEEGAAFLELFLEKREKESNRPLISPIEVFSRGNGNPEE